MTYTLLIEKERNTPETNIGNFLMFFNRFFSVGKLERIETESEIRIRGFNMSLIARLKISDLRQDGAIGEIRLLEESNGIEREIRVSPALPMSETYSETKSRYRDLNKAIRISRMRCANVTEEMLQRSSVSAEKHRAMIIADSIFPDFKIGEIVTIDDLWQYDVCLPEYDEQQQFEISGVDENGSIVCVACTYKLAHPTLDFYDQIKQEDYGNIEIEITDIQSSYEGEIDTQ